MVCVCLCVCVCVQLSVCVTTLVYSVQLNAYYNWMELAFDVRHTTEASLISYSVIMPNSCRCPCLVIKLSETVNISNVRVVCTADNGVIVDVAVVEILPVLAPTELPHLQSEVR